MKICHVNLARSFGGGERQTLHLIKQQLREGYTLTVVARHNTRFAKEVEKLPCKMITTRKLLPNHSAKLNKQCQLVHAHEEHAVAWAYMQFCLYNTPYIITRRSSKALNTKFISTKSYQNARAIIALSTDILQSIKQKFPDLPSYKIPSSPISYPVNQNKVDQIWSSHGYKFLVMHATRLTKHKGFDVTIEAARILQDKQSPVHFLLLGNGPDKELLQKQAEGLDNVFFMSNQVDMGTWFASANVLIHPSYSEGLGAVILEAMAAGLPVIGSNTGGIPDIIEHEQTGLLVTPGNAKELANAIERLQEDQVLRQELQNKAKLKVKEFEIPITSKSYQEVYQNVLN